MRTFVVLLLAACHTEEEVELPTDPAQFNVRMENVAPANAVTPSTGDPTDAKFAPGVMVIHDDSFQLFEPGQPIAFPGFEALVEDGDNAPLLAEIEELPGVIAANSYAALDENYVNSPMAPGDSAWLTEWAEPGDRLTLVAMYGESNDAFVATPPEGLALFDDGNLPIYGEIAHQMDFWDAGTEVNEEPGAGAGQPARQSGPGAGTPENGTVERIDGTDVAGFAYPAADAWISVEVTGEEE